MNKVHLLMYAALAVAITSCGDSPRSIQAPTEPSLNGSCAPASITLNPQNASVTQGQNLGYSAFAGGNGCTITDNVGFAWSVSDPSRAQVGATSVNNAAKTATATILGVAPGTVQVTVRAWTAGSDTVSRTTDLTVVAPTPTPTVSGIAGPATVTASGTYNYSVTASGGNNSSYSYTWETRHSGGGWTVAHTATGGSTSTAPIAIVGGRLYEVRVKVTSGTSAVATSAVLTVDATAATPPLSVSLIGPDNIRERGVHEWEAAASGGSGSYTYSWRMERPDGSEVTGYTGTLFSWWFDSCDDEPDGSFLEVTVTSGGQTATAILSLNVETYLRSPCD